MIADFYMNASLSPCTCTRASPTALAPPPLPPRTRASAVALRRGRRLEVRDASDRSAVESVAKMSCCSTTSLEATDMVSERARASCRCTYSPQFLSTTRQLGGNPSSNLGVVGVTRSHLSRTNWGVRSMGRKEGKADSLGTILPSSTYSLPLAPTTLRGVTTATTLAVW